MSTKVDALFFDLDDTLVMWKKVHLSVIQEAIREISKEHTDIDPRVIAETVARVSKQSTNDLNSGTISFDHVSSIVEDELVSVGVARELACKLYPNYWETYFRNMKAFPDCEVLKELSKSYILGVISNGPKEWQIEKLKMTGLFSLFDIVLCSSEIGICKPDKRIFEEACRRIGIATSRSIMIGNGFTSDVIGAREAGMQSVWLNRDNIAIPDSEWIGVMIHTLNDLPNCLVRLKYTV